MMRRASVLYALIVAGPALFAYQRGLMTQEVNERFASTWLKGTCLSKAHVADHVLPTAPDEGAVVIDHVTAKRALPLWLLVYSLVPGRDAIVIQVDDRSVTLLPDELVRNRIYETEIETTTGIGIGANRERILALASMQLGKSVDEVERRGVFARARAEREAVIDAALPKARTDNPASPSDLALHIEGGALYMSAATDDHGRFRYWVDAGSGEPISHYEFARHAGALHFLAQAWSVVRSEKTAQAATRAARYMLSATEACAGHRCIVHNGQVDFGGTALGLAALAEGADSGVPGFSRADLREPAFAFANFLRASQRKDGEFQHQLDRKTGKFIDVQLPFFSGEAAYALARFGRAFDSREHLDAAAHAVRYLTTEGWSFFGNRYLYGAEHWTCQAVAALYPSHPLPDALNFCIRWSDFGDKIQQRSADAPFDVEGNYGVGPFLAPQLISIGGRAEGVMGTLTAARLAHIDKRIQERLRLQAERSIAIVMRYQFGGGDRHRLADASMLGGVPTSPVDLRVRIDGVQHGVGAMVMLLRELQAVGSAP